MTPEAHGPDPEIEALVVDRYLESLLARRPVDPAGVPIEVRATAARLAAVAARISAGELVELPAPSAPISSVPGGRSGRAHPAVIGGVVTSAAVSIAGAAYVAWRLRRPTDPMTRAIRAVARARVI
jgi:hypothetical protein